MLRNLSCLGRKDEAESELLVSIFSSGCEGLLAIRDRELGVKAGNTEMSPIPESGRETKRLFGGSYTLHVL